MAKKLESNFINMLLVLFIVTLVASFSVGYVNSLTAEQIELAKQEKQVKAIQKVVPEFNNDPMNESYKIKSPDGGELEVFPAKKDGVLVGNAVKTFTNKGFSGEIIIMVGLTPDGNVYNYSVLEHKETPGLGSKMDVWFVKDAKGDIIGTNPGDKQLVVKKDGGSVDAIAAATISSRAFLDAVNKAAVAMKNTQNN